MPTEDHPLEYADHEGVIKAGEYGAGALTIRDEGIYRGLATDRRGHEIPFAEALEDGHASFWLDGAKLHGGYALTRTRGGRDGERESRLLVKKHDRYASSHDAPDPRRARSARPGRTLGRVAADAETDRR
ncbi:DNA polymerase ligase N-terminal domain-containing protein [Streptomyces sp. NPDC048389]|uniref:DNA polymerase ligase N-terminal domain-containing protein n=1 Tax=Streptomyces sp. NPDC048389 TaxID=3154622 RepID=UPI00345428DB